MAGGFEKIDCRTNTPVPGGKNLQAISFSVDGKLQVVDRPTIFTNAGVQAGLYHGDRRQNLLDAEVFLRSITGSAETSVRLNGGQLLPNGGFDTTIWMKGRSREHWHVFVQARFDLSCQPFLKPNLLPLDDFNRLKVGKAGPEIFELGCQVEPEKTFWRLGKEVVLKFEDLGLQQVLYYPPFMTCWKDTFGQWEDQPQGQFRTDFISNPAVIEIKRPGGSLISKAMGSNTIVLGVKLKGRRANELNGYMAKALDKPDPLFDEDLPLEQRIRRVVDPYIRLEQPA